MANFEFKTQEYVASSDEGAFKFVEMYDDYVVKHPRNEGGEYRYTEYGSYSDADEAECYEELAREYNFVKKFAHLKITPPIFRGDETCYYMKKAKTFGYIEAKDAKTKVVKDKISQELVSFYHSFGKRKNKKSFLVRESMIAFAAHIIVREKAPYKTVLETLKKIILVDLRRNLLGDMHSSNYGMYKKNVSIIDAGQVNEEPKLNEFESYFQGFLKYEVGKNKNTKLLSHKYNNDFVKVTYGNRVVKGYITKVSSNSFRMETRYENGEKSERYIPLGCLEDLAIEIVPKEFIKTFKTSRSSTFKRKSLRSGRY